MLRLLTCCALLLPIFLHAVPVEKNEIEIGGPVVFADPDELEEDVDVEKRAYYGGYGGYSSTASEDEQEAEIIDHAAEGGTGRAVRKCTEALNETIFCTYEEDAEGITEYGISPADKELIITFHNQVRAEAKAKNMMEMHWDDEIAEFAQKWSQTCVKGHDANKERRIPAWGIEFGQNWAGGSTIEGSLNNWAKEKTVYTFNDTEANSQVMIGHYTQMVQAHANAFGCGYSNCLNPRNGKYFRNFVCNYAYGQLAKQIQTPYIVAETNRQKGSMCKETTEDKLCKSSVVCKNKGKFNLGTGQCDCVAPYTGGEDCCVPDCTIPDVDSCNTGKKIEEYCDNYSNLRGLCRFMCGDCTARH